MYLWERFQREKVLTLGLKKFMRIQSGPRPAKGIGRQKRRAGAGPWVGSEDPGTGT